MKKTLLAFMLIVACGTLAAQDIITKTDADEIEAIVTRIGSDQIEYRRWDNPEGPVYTLPTDQVFVIKYRNGTKEVFTTAASPQKSRTKYGGGSYPAYVGEVTAGFGLGVGAVSNLIDTNRIHFETVHGCRINPYFFSGIGLGIDYFYKGITYTFNNSYGTRFDFTYTGGLVLPVFADFKGYCPVGRKTALYMAWDLGAAIGIGGWAEGTEFYTSVGPGIELGNPHSARANLGIRFQHMGAGLNAVLFRVGLSF